ncbi:hypothetical protein F0562_026399 [Nyssa sinensis]|uniref:ABC1 atypical kinase-like domain-containing protein n=1 Tax=Nyssa sinensis TaxID=561372 RepID=A0A5J5BDA5_9ASTE|nr:hypothetical protein F0562_026399 [Nyssa sinensis]
MAVVSVFRGVAHGRFPLLQHPQLPGTSISARPRNLKFRSSGFTLFARYSQSQDLFTSRLQDSIENLPKLVEDIVQTSINTGPRGALRLAQGIQAVIGVGGEWLADVSKSTNSSAGLPTQLQLGLLSPLYLRRLFERMGATYIKLGQFIASAPTLFPPEYVQEFHVYEYVDPTPIASASIAQVHDLNFVYIVARILEFLNPELSRASLVGIVKDIKESMLEEVDFNKEAVNIESFRRYLEAMGLVRQATAPKVYPQCSTRRVLTMERLYGVPLTDLDSISSLVSSPETSLITALNVWFGFLDFGIVGRISPKTWAAMEVFLASIATEGI